ncbi:BQ5605_C004g02978 [Microbotryum silenes-dioicae]|uniref:BQ5605_C004g02978 protein n=1 Tax=Microbotryum silenes-dioicae TaxID=796604 RepID=A0A2X0MDW4_9BASI|nr:BQ5605_C004g02978 [Microbotryum silenes-dioicae]
MYLKSLFLTRLRPSGPPVVDVLYQHTAVSAAPACGVHVPIRSHVQALCAPMTLIQEQTFATMPRSQGRQGGPSQPRQVLGREGSAVPWACSSARCWAPRGSTLLFVPHRSTESAPRRVMTTMQPILALRHVYEPAVQLCRTDSVVSAMANSTLGSPHHHLRKGECAGLESRSNPSSPTFSQGKLLQGSDSDAKAFREDARSYNNALSFTSLAAHCWDQTQVDTLGPPVFRVFGRLYHRLGALILAVNQRPAFAQTSLIDPAEATNTRLQGPDSAETRIQRSTLTKLESMLRTGNCFVREFASAKGRAGWDTAKEWVLRLCLPPGRDRRTHNLPTTLFSRCTVIDVPMVGPSTKSLARSIRPRCLSVTHYFFLQGKMASTPTFLFAGSTKPGRQSPETESRSTMVSNCARYLPVLVWMTKTNRRTKTATMRMKTARKGTKRMVMANVRVFGSFSEAPFFSRSQFFAHYLPNATSTSQSRIATNVLSWSLFDPEPNCDITQRDQDAMACAVKHGKPPLLITMTCVPESPQTKAALGPNDKACTRPDLIAQVFEAKSGNKRHAGCFGDECRMNGFASLLYFVGCFLNLCAEIM